MIETCLSARASAVLNKSDTEAELVVTKGMDYMAALRPNIDTLSQSCDDGEW